jgi:hypothetical protein
VETPDRRLGRGDVVGVVVVLALFVASMAWLAVLLEPLNHRCLPSDVSTAGADRAADDLRVAAARLPGVVAVEAAYTPGDCDRVGVALTVDADADPDLVAAAVAFVAAGLDAPELRADHVGVSVEDNGPEHSPGAGRPSLSLTDTSRAPDAVAVVARAWAQLKEHYRSTNVKIDYYYDSVRVQLPRPADSAAVREAFHVLRGLGLTERTSGNQTFWDVGVAGPGPIHYEPDINYGVRGDLTSAEGIAAIGAVAAWSAALGPGDRPCHGGSVECPGARGRVARSHGEGDRRRRRAGSHRRRGR